MGDGYNEQMAAVHNANADALLRIIDTIGYPTIGRVGEEGSAAAWLIVQHAIGRPGVMRRCAALLAEAVAGGQAEPLHLAYLTDRIAVFEGRPQAYGTQFDWDEDGQLSPQPHDDPQLVDQRRAALGLTTLAEQTRTIRERSRQEGENAPPDRARRRAAYERWRRDAGWAG